MTTYPCSGPGCSRTLDKPDSWCISCEPETERDRTINDAIRTVERRMAQRRADRPHTGRRDGEIKTFPTEAADQIVDAALSYMEACKKNHSDRLTRLERLAFLARVELSEIQGQAQEQETET